MKVELGRSLLQERMREASVSLEELAMQLRYKPERLSDYIEGKRIMPLKTAVSIARTLGCTAEALYEWVPAD